MTDAAYLDSIEDIFFAFDETGLVVEWNQAAIDVTGYAADELAEMTIAEFFENDADRVLDTVTTVLETGEATIEADLVTADSTHHPYEFSLRRLPDESPAAFVGIGRDISARVQRRDQLEAQNEKLEQFAAVVSHDLRNPLNVIAGSLELTEETGDLSHLQRAQTAIQRMDALIDDLLTLSRSGDVIDDTETIELAPFVRSCWENVPTEGANLVVGAEQTIQADKTRLQQLVENLLRNAVEHGGGTVTITVGDLASGFYIEDDGDGIAAGDQQYLFESGFSTAPDGTGFGLAIVAEIVDAHDWEIEATESATGGAKFEITEARTE